MYSALVISWIIGMLYINFNKLYDNDLWRRKVSTGDNSICSGTNTLVSIIISVFIPHFWET